MSRPLRRFILKLCKTLKKTQGELLRGPHALTGEDLIEWVTEDSIEALDDAEDSRAAVIAMVLANVNRRPGSDPFTIANFIAELRLYRRESQEPKEAKEITVDGFATLLTAGGMSIIKGVRPE